MKKNSRYYFDDQTIEYVELKINWKTLIVKYLLCLSTAIVLLYATHPWWRKIKEIEIYKDREKILTHTQKAKMRFMELEKSLERVHNNDQTFYRSILNQNPLDPSLWEGGVGGQEPNSAHYIAPEMKTIAQTQARLQYKCKLQNQSFEAIEKIAFLKSEELKQIPAVRPLDGKIVSGFGYRADPFYGYGHFHSGIDMVARIGAPIKTTGNGIIKTAGCPESGYGLQVEVDHGYGYVTKYAHLSAIHVSVGQKVKRGEIIGLVGNTGYSTGPHLHYEVIKNGTKVNPLDYFYTE